MMVTSIMLSCCNPLGGIGCDGDAGGDGGSAVDRVDNVGGVCGVQQVNGYADEALLSGVASSLDLAACFSMCDADIGSTLFTRMLSPWYI
eukprot:2169778-Rhodomonas_salina.1